MQSIKIKFHLIILMVFVMNNLHYTEDKIKSKEGFINVTGGKVWYRIDGEGDKIPLLLLHGGPGVPSDYLNPLKELGKDRPVIFFDQPGCGRSDKITDSTLLTVDYFVEQVEEIREALDLKKFYLYGQSWGTMLGVDYYLKYPDKIKGIIFSSPCLSVDRWIQDAKRLITQLPDTIQNAIRINEENKTYNSPEYQLAMQVYYENFIARKLPWSNDLVNAISNIDMNVYLTMWGPSEFNVTGVLKDFDRTNRLSEIKIPTLLMCGEFDEATPETVKYYHSLIPNSKFVVIKNSAHETMIDNPEENNKAISDFLNELEK
ncbi:MAG: alpha/beta fold hydrolase [Ignavibacteriales bacterium]|nr:MAG: alpha/beta fold hydrolase [Ignavibacteriales bacterium]